jgi:hypothetical protein
MKITMFLTDNAMQFNLDPESDHEKEFVSLLRKYTGAVSIQAGADIGMSKAGYVRNFGEGVSSRIVAIVIRKPEPNSNEV